MGGFEGFVLCEYKASNDKIEILLATLLVYNTLPKIIHRPISIK
jgi:hypothetical protein